MFEFFGIVFLAGWVLFSVYLAFYEDPATRQDREAQKKMWSAACKCGPAEWKDGKHIAAGWTLDCVHHAKLALDRKQRLTPQAMARNAEIARNDPRYYPFD